MNMLPFDPDVTKFLKKSKKQKCKDALVKTVSGVSPVSDGVNLLNIKMLNDKLISQSH